MRGGKKNKITPCTSQICHRRGFVCLLKTFPTFAKARTTGSFNLTLLFLLQGETSPDGSG